MVPFGLISLGISELLVVAVLVIVFVGPDRLPEMMRFVGRQYGRLRRASDELRRAFQLEVDRVDSEQRAQEIRLRREELMARRRAEREANAAMPVAREDELPDGQAAPAQDPVDEDPDGLGAQALADAGVVPDADDPAFPVDDEPELPEVER